MNAPHLDRFVPLEGGHNFRDIGGYPTRDGRQTAWGRVFRSGSMAELSEPARAMLAELGLRVVCDLRSTPERSRKPSRLPEMHEFEILSRDYDASVADLLTAMRQPGVTADNSLQFMRQFYRELPYEQSPMYRELFLKLAGGTLPLLFHCAAGKDRTGVAAAVLLEVLGVERQEVINDYVLTDHFFENGCRMVRSNHDGTGISSLDEAIWLPMMRADPSFLEAMFDTIDSRHGSSEGFVREELGLGSDEIAALKQHLLV